MKRLAFLLLPLFVLAACENSIPTAIDGTDETATVVIEPTPDPSDPDAVPTNVNLAVAKAIQLVVPDQPFVPASAVATHVTASGVVYTDTDDHTINAGCTTHFQDTDNDGVVDALVLHFEPAVLFPDNEYPSSITYPIAATVTLDVEFVDPTIDPFHGTYLVQLVYNSSKGKGGRP